MKLICDGRRLQAREVNAVLAIAGETVMAATMQQLGFRLLPSRAPKRLRGGNLVLRFAWERRDGNLKIVVRSTITLEAPAAV